MVLVAREQLLVNRHGVAVKGEGPHGGRRRDLAWAGAGAAAVLVAGLALGSLQAPAAAAEHRRRGSGPADTAQVHPTTALGDVSNFATIADRRPGQGELRTTSPAADRGSRTSKSPGTAPRPDSSHATLPTGTPSTVRSTTCSPPCAPASPNQADCAANLNTLIDTLNTYDGG